LSRLLHLKSKMKALQKKTPDQAIQLTMDTLFNGNRKPKK